MSGPYTRQCAACGRTRVSVLCRIRVGPCAHGSTATTTIRACQYCTTAIRHVSTAVQTRGGPHAG
eukprot:3281337-Rhodomonas_salina.2